MNQQILKKPTLELVAGIAIIVAGLVLRIRNLDLFPLTDGEANLALQSVQLLNGNPIPLSGEPLYLVLTTILFALINPGAFAARCAPALIGAILPAAPLLMRPRLGTRAAFSASILLAIDPALVLVSRQADGPMISLVLVVFTGLFLSKRSWKLAGAGAALSLLSGSGVWFFAAAGVIALLITWVITRGSAKGSLKPEIRWGSLYREAWITFLLVLGGGGTLLLLMPQGISLIGTSFVDFIGRFQTSGDPLNQYLAGILLYYPLIVVLGIIGWITSLRDYGKSAVLAGCFAMVIFLVGLTLPGRDTRHLIWTVAPLMFFANDWFWKQMDLRKEDILQVGLITGFLGVISGFVWMNINHAFRAEPGVENWIAIIAAVVMFLGTILLVMFGWSIRYGKLGVLILVGILTTYSFLSISTRGTAFPDSRFELFGNSSIHTDAQILQDTIGDLAEMNYGGRTNMPVKISGINSPSLEWTIQLQEDTAPRNSSGMTTPEAVMLTSDTTDDGFSDAYRGQVFQWNTHVPWEQLDFRQWMVWLIWRDAPEVSDNIVLWARADLFPGMGSQ